MKAADSLSPLGWRTTLTTMALRSCLTPGAENPATRSQQITLLWAFHSASWVEKSIEDRRPPKHPTAGGYRLGLGTYVLMVALRYQLCLSFKLFPIRV